MQKREDINFTRYDRLRIAEVNGSRKVDFEKKEGKNVNYQLKWISKAEFNEKFKGGFKKFQKPLARSTIQIATMTVRHQLRKHRHYQILMRKDTQHHQHRT